MKSDDFSSMYTSAGEVHLSGAEEGSSHDASLYDLSLTQIHTSNVLTFGEEKLSFGNTAPYSSMHSRMCLLTWGKL